MGLVQFFIDGGHPGRKFEMLCPVQTERLRYGVFKTWAAIFFSLTMIF